MAFSYLSVIYTDITREAYLRGRKLARENAVEITRSFNNGCKAVVHPDTDYPVKIGFARVGSPEFSCICADYSYGCICDHIIAVAIAYDWSRDVIFPSDSDWVTSGGSD